MSSPSSYASPFKASCLSDRVALITGGGSGIGLEISRQLAVHGAKVVIMGRRDAVLQAALSKLTAEGIPSSSLASVSGDVRKSEDAAKAVALAVQRFGKLNVLINGAAGNFLTPAELLSSNGFRTVLDIDTVGTFTMCQAAFQELKKSGNATILNISAVLHYGATWYQVHSSAAKAAIDSVTASLALEWGEFNIRVNTIAPGPIADTPGFAKLGGDLAGGSKAAEEALTATVPLKRAGLKLDVGLAAVYLVSKAGNYISGAHLVVDGGSWFGKPPMADREVIVQFSRKAEKAQKQKSSGQIVNSKL